MMRLPGMGPRTVERILDGIEASKNVPFERVVYALSIPYVGETVAKKLARAVRDIDTLMEADIETLTSIDDIGPRIAESITEYFNNPVNRDMVEHLRAAGLRMSMPEEDESSRTSLLEGKTIVISGTFSRHSRDEYKEMIERNGGKNASGISKKTDFVLAGENMGPAKLEKARSLNVPIINEDEFLAMITQ